MNFIPIVRIVRLEENHQYGTFGVATINTEVFCVTLEPKDWWNQPNMSCVPAQQYLCRRIISPRHGETFEVLDVPKRSRILFHPLNIDNQTEGCIGLAQHFGKLKIADKSERAVLNSGKTFKAFMEKMKGYDTFHLTILTNY